MRARAPASSANLGPGFDTLAVALDRFVEVEVEPAARLVVRTEGEGAGLADDPSHLAARVAIDVAGTDRLAITVRSQIPVARGLGSSAALAAAAAAAAGAPDPLAVAAAIDGHADNAAASVAGGLVAAATVRGGIRAVRLPLDAGLAFVVIVPDLTLSTARARQALPTEVPRESATFNLSRLALLVAGLADSRVLVPEATEDRLHQDYRSPLFPAAPQLLMAMSESGALAVCWSGAGPSLLGICRSDVAPAVQAGATAALTRAELSGQVLILHPDLRGLIVDDGEGRPLETGPGSGADRPPEPTPTSKDSTEGATRDAESEPGSRAAPAAPAVPVAPSDPVAGTDAATDAATDARPGPASAGGQAGRPAAVADEGAEAEED